MLVHDGRLRQFTRNRNGIPLRRCLDPTRSGVVDPWARVLRFISTRILLNRGEVRARLRMGWRAALFTLAMWTRESRGRMAELARKTRRYPSDLTDEEWAVVEPLLPKPARRTSLRSPGARARPPS